MNHKTVSQDNDLLFLTFRAVPEPVLEKTQRVVTVLKCSQQQVIQKQEGVTISGFPVENRDGPCQPAFLGRSRPGKAA